MGSILKAGFLGLFMSIWIAPLVHADILTSFSLFYRSTTDQTGSSTATTTYTFYNLRVGSVQSSGFYFGGIYHLENIAFTGSSTARTSLGGSVGYVGTDAGVIAHYFLSSKYDDGSTVQEGTGIGVDVFYVFGLSGNLDIGPQLSWKNFTYTKDNSGSLANDHVMSGIDPYVTFIYRF